MSETVSHLWVGKTPKFGPELLVVDRESNSGNLNKIQIELYDHQGILSTKAEYEYPKNNSGYISLDPFLTPLPIEQGMQYGHLVVKSENDARFLLRWSGENIKEVSQAPRIVKPREPVFFPLYINSQTDHALFLVNTSNESVAYTIRLFAGQRSPEISLELPPMAASTFSVMHEFWSKLRDIDASGALQSYLRVSINQTGTLAAGLLESFEDNRIRIVS